MDILIIDDDLLFAEKLKKDVFDYFSKLYEGIKIHIINSDFKAVLNSTSVDLVFLDVDLKEKYNGLELGLHLKKAFPKTVLVFDSLNDDFVFPALSIGLFQFIRKSEYDTDIIKVLNQIKKYIDENVKKTLIRINGTQYSIKLSDIKYILSIGHDLFIKTINDDFTINLSLRQFMKDINYEELVQIANNLVININYTEKVTKSKVLMLDSDEEYVVGRKYQNALVEKYKDFLLR